MKLHAALTCALAIICSPFSSSASDAEYLQSFDPAKGFKPAQRDLTEVFLQLAGSLESYGSPIPYVKHVAAENRRVEEIYRAKNKKTPPTFRPAHMTDEYINRTAANWDLLSPKIGLEPFAKEFGHMMRDAIKGTRGTGTILVDIFNEHQSAVFSGFTGKSSDHAGFEALKTELVKQLELEKSSIEEGRYEVARRDAVRCAIIIREITTKLFVKLDKGLQPAAAESVKAVLRGVIMETGMMAQSELEIGIAEWAMSEASTASR